MIVNILSTTCNHICFEYDGNNYEYAAGGAINDDDPDILKLVKIDTDGMTASEARIFLNGKEY